MKTKTILGTITILACGALVAPRVASADDATEPFGYGWQAKGMQSEVGVSTVLGAGLGGFTNQTMRDTVTSNVAGLWNLRVTIGSHLPIAVDLGYVGTASNIDVFDNTQRTLVGTTLEGALRYNVLPHYAFTPYAFAGIGWQRYDISGTSFSLADAGMNQSDNSVVFPLGTGIAYRDKTGIVLDLHGTFRANYGQSLVPESIGSTNFAPMHSWEASGAFGYEF